MGKKLFVKVTADSQETGYIARLEDVSAADLIQDEYESYSLAPVMLTEEEFAALPEFEGF